MIYDAILKEISKYLSSLDFTKQEIDLISLEINKPLHLRNWNLILPIFERVSGKKLSNIAWDKLLIDENWALRIRNYRWVNVTENYILGSTFRPDVIDKISVLQVPIWAMYAISIMIPFLGLVLGIMAYCNIDRFVNTLISSVLFMIFPFVFKLSQFASRTNDILLKK